MKEVLKVRWSTPDCSLGVAASFRASSSPHSQLRSRASLLPSIILHSCSRNQHVFQDTEGHCTAKDKVRLFSTPCPAQPITDNQLESRKASSTRRISKSAPSRTATSNRATGRPPPTSSPRARPSSSRLARAAPARTCATTSSKSTRKPTSPRTSRTRPACSPSSEPSHPMSRQRRSSWREL